jgi:hypothetical protein
VILQLKDDGHPLRMERGRIARCNACLQCDAGRSKGLTACNQSNKKFSYIQTQSDSGHGLERTTAKRLCERPTRPASRLRLSFVAGTPSERCARQPLRKKKRKTEDETGREGGGGRGHGKEADSPHTILNALLHKLGCALQALHSLAGQGSERERVLMCGEPTSTVRRKHNTAGRRTEAR